MKIYVIQGQTGEYDDFREWSVKAFTTEEKAQKFVNEINSWCKENKVYSENDRIDWDIYCEFNNNRKFCCPLDPNFDIDYTGTIYYYFELELENE